MKDYDDKWGNIYGGSFVDDLKKLGRKAHSAVSSAVPYVKKALPYVEKGLEMALPLLAAGAGITERQAQGIIDKYGYDVGMEMLKDKKRLKGRGVVGGKKKGGAIAGKSAMRKQLSLY